MVQEQQGETGTNVRMRDLLLLQIIHLMAILWHLSSSTCSVRIFQGQRAEERVNLLQRFSPGLPAP